MGKPISEYLKTRIKELHQLGYNNRKIARLCNLSDALVFYQINGRVKRKKNTQVNCYHLDERGIQYLIDYYGKIPVRDIAKYLGKSIQFVYNKAQELGLKVYNPDPVNKKLIRPPAVYTNSRSHYGISDDLHAGTRIFK